jgi:hypothetical protein
LPQPPSAGNSDILAEAEITRRRQAMARNQTMNVSPLGVAGEANVARKTLLGK